MVPLILGNPQIASRQVMQGEACVLLGDHPQAIRRVHVGDCQNYGPFLGPYNNTGPNTGPNLGDPKRDHNFDNPPRS